MAGRDVFHFGGFTLEVRERRLFRGTDIVRLSPKAYEVLVALVSEPGRRMS
jgi:DNA-binding winged helix-turn-helix (wHTH) protein